MRLWLISGVLLAAQLGSMSAPERSKQHVAYVAEAQTIGAGRPAVLALHFRIDDGFHVNSHTPKSEFLIPTALTLAG